MAKKSQVEKARKRLRKGRGRKNPDAFPGGLEFVTGLAGNLAISAALSGCTFHEKALIAVLIPTWLKIIRSVPAVNAAKAAEKLYPITDEAKADEEKAGDGKM